MSDKQEKNKSKPDESKEPITNKGVKFSKNFFADPKLFASKDKDISELASLGSKSKELTTAQKKREIYLMTEMMQTFGLENGLWVTLLSHLKFHSALAEIRRKILEDYDCHTAIELMIADRITANYWQTMTASRQLNNFIENEDGSLTFSQLRINLIKELNNSIEKADRQLNANVILLKELKQPKLNIKVNTENAYIAQNQQVINTDKDGSKSVNSESLEANNLGKK